MEKPTQISSFNLKKNRELSVIPSAKTKNNQLKEPLSGALSLRQSNQKN
jgi:hypothetical protein